MQDLNDFVWFVKVVDYGGLRRREGRLISQVQAEPPDCAAGRAAWRAFDSANHPAVYGDRGRADFYQHCKAMLVEAEAAEEAVAALQAEPRGVVRITCPVTCCMSTWDRCWRDLWRATRDQSSA
jgi:hypothetical protein